MIIFCFFSFVILRYAFIIPLCPRFGVGADPVEGAGTTDFSIRIRNERNHASSWTKLGDEEWKPSIVKDVSGFHHNNYNGFFALRPAYFLRGGAELVKFTYQPL